MKKIFITGESGTIPIAMQKLSNVFDIEVVNSQFDDKYNLKQYKKHRSFSVREYELDFLDFDLLNSNILKNIFSNLDCIVHSGAFVGTDFCNQHQEEAIRTNIQGTKNIVDICNKYNIPLIYFSTTAIFDPESYSENNPITEKTNINPRTLYGITKYSGELITKKMCALKNTIVRPVFGFGNYPDDLHSALTKVIYTVYYNYKNSSNNKLIVLLDKSIKKSYTRVENIASVVLHLCNNLITEEINVGEHYSNSVDWYTLFELIAKAYYEIANITEDSILQILNDTIQFVPKADYLHYHNIDDCKISLQDQKKYIHLYSGIKKTIISVMKNIDKNPYWL